MTNPCPARRLLCILLLQHAAATPLRWCGEGVAPVGSSDRQQGPHGLCCSLASDDCMLSHGGTKCRDAARPVPPCRHSMSVIG